MRSEIEINHRSSAEYLSFLVVCEYQAWFLDTCSHRGGNRVLSLGRAIQETNGSLKFCS